MADHQTLAPSPSAASKKKHSKKRKAIDVTIDASLTGAAAPVVAYFPTGYDPMAASEPPRARLFRHEKHSSRIELVVGAPGRGAGATPARPPRRKLCGYTLGVLDKASGTLKVVPIAANKILRLEPHFEAQQPTHSQHSEAVAELGSSTTSAELKIQEQNQ